MVGAEGPTGPAWLPGAGGSPPARVHGTGRAEAGGPDAARGGGICRPARPTCRIPSGRAGADPGPVSPIGAGSAGGPGPGPTHVPAADSGETRVSEPNVPPQLTLGPHPEPARPPGRGAAGPATARSRPGRGTLSEAMPEQTAPRSQGPGDRKETCALHPGPGPARPQHSLEVSAVWGGWEEEQREAAGGLGRPPGGGCGGDPG